jgi:hypothetical protein
MALGLSLLISTALLWPVKENWQSNPQDDFPLSYNPMFSHKRKATYAMPYVVGYDAEQNRYLIPYRYAGTGGFNQVRRQMRKMVRQEQSDLLLNQVVEKLNETNREPYNKLVKVALVKGKYHLDDYFLREQKKPLEETILSTQTLHRP